MSSSPNLRRSRATAASLGAGAVALAGLVAVAPAASAAPATNNYVCSNPVAGSYNVTVVTDVPLLQPTAPAGMDVAADLLDVTNHVTIPAAAYQTFTGFGVTSIDMSDYRLAFGDSTVGASTALAVAPTAFKDNGNGTYSADINAKNAAFEVPAAGTYSVTAPAAYRLMITLGNGSTAELTCSVPTGSTPTAVGSVRVAKNASSLKARAKKVALGKPARVRVTVAAPNQTPTGRVIARIGTTRVGKAKLNARGKAVIRVKAKFLSPGKNRVKLRYKGDGYTLKAKGKKIVKVVG